MSSVVKTTSYSLVDCEVVGVEAGNYGKTTAEDTVVAFSCKCSDDTKRYKVIVKGELAYNIYRTFLITGGSMSKVIELEHGVKVDRRVTVSLIADLKEDGVLEVKLRNPSNIEFKYDYKIL